MTENIVHIKIPLERVGVLIGPSGRTKKTLQKKYHITIGIEGKSGNVWISPESHAYDPAGILRARDIIRAIGRGFSPEKAFRLFHEDTSLLFIDLRDIFDKSESDIVRVKGRLIGKKGKTRRIIEELTGVHLCIYGHTISIIGDQNQVNMAKEAIERLIRGDQHKTVYDFLQRRRHELRLQEIELWETEKEFNGAR